MSPNCRELFDLDADLSQNISRRSLDRMPRDSLSVIIPAYNEEKTIERTLSRVFECVPSTYEAIVIDDASEDLTPEIVHQMSLVNDRIKLYRHRVNGGKTEALKTGFAAVTGSIIVIQDADMEYDPEEIPKLILPIVEARADVSLGSRFMVRQGGHVLYHRHYLANKFLTFVSNILTNLHITDVETGYKACRLEIAKNMIIESAGFGFEIEFIAKCKKIGARIYEVPITYRGRTYEEGKKIGLKDGLDAIWYLFKFNLLRTRKGSFQSDFTGRLPNT